MSDRPDESKAGHIPQTYVTQNDLDELKTAISEYRRFTWGNLVWLLGFALILLFTTLLLVPGVQIVLANRLGVEMQLSPSAGDPAGSASSTSQIFPQFMTLFLAVAAGGIAYMASMMGMRRLQNYDDQFQRFRSEQRDFEKDSLKFRETVKFSADAERKEINALAEEIKTSLSTAKVRQEAELEKATKDVSRAIEAARSKQEQSLDAAKHDIKEMTEDALERTKSETHDTLKRTKSEIDKIAADFNRRFGFVGISESTMKALFEDASVSEIHKRVTNYFSQGEAKEARQLVSDILSVRHVDRESLRATGELNDWFNLGSQLGQSDEFLLGLKVNFAGLLQQGAIALEEGISGVQRDHQMTLKMSEIIENDETGNDTSLKLVAPNVDLLAHSISYAHKLGELELLNGLIRIADLLPLELRNWRYYQFLADVYADRNDRENFERIVTEFEKRIVNDERSVAVRLSWHLSRNEYERAVEIGREWLNNPTSRGSAVPLRLATAALDAGDYDFVLELTARALEGSAESQPSANIGAILFYRANAYDSLLCREAAMPRPDCERIVDLFHKARRLYESRLAQSVTHQAITAPRRLETMRLLLAETGCAPEEDTEAPMSPPESDDDENIHARLMAILNAGIGSFVEGDEDAQQQAVAAFRTLPSAAQVIAKLQLQSFVDDEDRPTRHRDAARAFLEAINRDED